MKLSKHAFVTFWDVHAWGGMLCALVLHLLFFFGAFTLVQDEIRVWEAPELHRPGPKPAPADVPALVQRHVPWAADPPEDIWVIFDQELRVLYKPRGAEEFVRKRVDPLTHAATPQRVYLADWLDSLHSLSIDGARWLERVAGLACVLLGLALVSGILIHLKDLVRQLFQLRLHKGTKVFWSDLHKVLGVWGLPFLLLFAWTGALLNLDDWMADGLGAALFSRDGRATQQALYGRPRPPALGDQTAEHTPLAELIQRGERELPGVRLRTFILRDVGRESGTLEMIGDDPAAFQGISRVRLSLGDGSVLRVSRAAVNETPWSAARRWLYELHYAEFGGDGALGLLVRLFYALGALGACALFLSGNWIWLARRDSARRHIGNRILARLTIGFGGGLAVATAVLFASSRLLPPEFSDRSFYMLPFFSSWACCLVWAFLPRSELSIWWQQLGAAAVGFALAPALALRHASAGLFGLLAPGGDPLDATVVGVDLLLGLLAVACALLAARLRRAARAEASRLARGRAPTRALATQALDGTSARAAEPSS